MSTIGFIGGGRVAQILLGGWAQAGPLPWHVVVNEPDNAAFDKLGGLAGQVEVERVSQQSAAASDIVILALHPPQIPDALSAIRSALGPGAIVVSLAPKITMRQMASAAATPRVARVIPNAPSIIRRGFNPIAFGEGLEAPGRGTLLALLSSLGDTPEVDEATLEAYAILTAMGPTYFWPQWQALRDVAREIGLSPAQADAGLDAMVRGALATLLHGSLTPGAVMDLIPVKPLGAYDAEVSARYHEHLTALHEKISPPAGQPGHGSTK